VQALCRHSAGHYLILATIASIEVASALARKVHDGRWSAVRRDQRLLGDLVFDFRFCTADRVQAAAAIAEGLQVELIS
jgi:hypothetical protein